MIGVSEMVATGILDNEPMRKGYMYDICRRIQL